MAFSVFASFSDCNPEISAAKPSTLSVMTYVDARSGCILNGVALYRAQFFEPLPASATMLILVSAMPSRRLSLPTPSCLGEVG